MTKKKAVLLTRDLIEDEEERNRLIALARKNNILYEKILEQYKEAIEDLKKQGITVNLERLAVNAVMNIYRKEKAKAKWRANIFRRPKKDVSIIYGFITGDNGIWDKAEQVRRRVKKFIEKNGIQAAVEAQMIDGDNNILDQRQKIYGRDNPNHLKVLPPELHVLERTLFGFFRKNGEKTYKYGSIQTSDNRLARGWSKVKFYTPCQVPAIVKEDMEDYIILGSSSAEDTMSIFRAVKEDVDIKKVIDGTIEGKWTEIKDIEKIHELTKDAWDRRIFVKGIVAWINIDRPTAIGSIQMGLMNPVNEDELVVVEIPAQLTVDFGELSEVYVFGKTRRSQHYDDDHKLVDGNVVIQATGVFPVIPTSRETVSSETTYEDTLVEGWLE